LFEYDLGLRLRVQEGYGCGSGILIVAAWSSTYGKVNGTKIDVSIRIEISDMYPVVFMTNVTIHPQSQDIYFTSVRVEIKPLA
jgi:hypothetical protein